MTRGGAFRCAIYGGFSALLLAAWACSGGAEGEVGSDPDVVGSSGGSSTLTASFVATDSPPPASSVSLQSGGSTGSTVAVDVQVTSVVGVGSASFDVVYDPTRLDFGGHTNSGFLGADGVDAQFTFGTQTPGRVVVSVVRLSGTQDAGAAGEDLVRLYFEATTSGSTDVALANHALNDANDAEIGGVTWSGGRVDAQ